MSALHKNCENCFAVCQTLLAVKCQRHKHLLDSVLRDTSWKKCSAAALVFILALISARLKVLHVWNSFRPIGHRKRWKRIRLCNASEVDRKMYWKVVSLEWKGLICNGADVAVFTHVFTLTFLSNWEGISQTALSTPLEIDHFYRLHLR